MWGGGSRWSHPDPGGQTVAEAAAWLTVGNVAPVIFTAAFICSFTCAALEVSGRPADPSPPSGLKELG